MIEILRRHLILPILLVFICSSASLVFAQDLPSQLSDAAFWKLVTEFSEEGGTFHSQNYVSNEATFQNVIPTLKQNTKIGGVYLGVGPEQNFTYIVEVQPRIAFIFDIRRQNLLQHLMYKALIELSSDRADFLSRLFSRPRPPGLSASSTTQELFQAFEGVPRSEPLFLASIDAIRTQLVGEHGFTLTKDDEGGIHFAMSAFFAGGPQLTYNGPTRRTNPGNQRLPTYADLMTQTDGLGQNRSYMASEESFRILQDLQRKNLVVPLVGDFAGERAIRGVGQYLKEHGAYVTTFYLSNVEQYLFEQGNDWSRFYTNVGTLPTDSSSTFIRSVFDGTGVGPVANNARLQSVSLLSSIQDLVSAFQSGKIVQYRDVILMSD